MRGFPSVTLIALWGASSLSLMKKIALLLFLIPLFTMVFSQEVLLDETFLYEELPEAWNVEGETFQLSIEDHALRVDYNRTASSWEWDQFNFTTDLLSVTSYSIQVDMKSDVNTEITLKPVYTDGNDEWLQQTISANSTFETYEFPVALFAEKKIEKIYFYFDAGSTEEISGTIYIDNLRIVAEVNTEQLEAAIGQATLFLDNITAGDGEGQFPAAALSSYQQAITSAQSMLNIPTLTQYEVFEAVNNLQDATWELERQVNISDAVATINFVDEEATFHTKYLYANLQRISDHRILFGMQDATGYGVGWSNDNDRSDVKDVCGSFPAVCSWSIKNAANGWDTNDDVYRMTKIYNLGGINTVEWHMNNPYGGDFYWDNNPYPDSNVVASLLPGGLNHDYYVEKLTNIAYFLRNLKGAQGESVPVIFRPFHEHNGNWFWWGAAHCTADEYKSLYQFTVDFLTEEMKVNNLLFAYSPDIFDTKSNYLQRYPGDAYVDILGFDDYWDMRYFESSFDSEHFVEQMRDVVEMAEERNKIAALTETGYEAIPYDEWFTDVLLNPLKNDPVAKKVAYAAVWRNASTSHHYAPYPGHGSADDFMDFYNDTTTVFLDDLQDMYNSLIEPGTNTIAELDHQQVVLYPNPAKTQFRITTDVEIIQLEIFNVTGVRVMVIQNSTDNTYDISGLRNGIYMLRLKIEDGYSITRKLIVDH